MTASLPSSRHSHEHAHNPMCLDDVVAELTRLTLAGEITWRRDGLRAWSATRAGVELYLEEVLYANDAAGQSLGESWRTDELRRTVMHANALDTQTTSALLAGLVEPTAEIQARQLAELEAELSAQRDRMWNALR